MAFQTISKKTGKTYFLHERKQLIKNREEPVTLYYFAGVAGECATDALPAGYEIGENKNTGLPFLRKTLAVVG